MRRNAIIAATGRFNDGGKAPKAGRTRWALATSFATTSEEVSNAGLWMRAADETAALVRATQTESETNSTMRDQADDPELIEDNTSSYRRRHTNQGIR